MKSLLQLLVFVLAATQGFAQNLYTAMPYIPVQFSYNSGAPVALGKVCTLAAGTSTPLAAYQTPTGTLHSNPIVLDSGGRPPGSGIFLTAASYKLIVYGPGTGNTCNGTSVGAVIKTIDNVLDSARTYCAQFPGATADVRIASCIADLVSTGGTADVRGIEGAQSWAACPFTGVTKPVTVLLGASTTSLAVNCTVPASVTLDFSQGSIISVASTRTLTISGGMDGSVSQRFAGAGTVVLTSTRIPEVYPEWWGADASDASTDAVAIQSAMTAACGNGSKVFRFASGTTVPTGAKYVLAGASITIPCGEVKLTGPKFTKITKTGTGNFFSIEPPGTVYAGYGFEVENLWLVGDESLNQIGFHFPGIDIGPYLAGPLHSRIHDSWFEAVGDKDTVDETAGGAVLIDSEALGFQFDNNIISQGGYSVRITTGNDGTKITHNVSNISRSVCYQFINTAGAASYEVSNNNCANVGGFLYTLVAGYMNIFGNSWIPGEAGSLGGVVKRNYETTSLAEDLTASGHEAGYIFRSGQFSRFHDNSCAVLAAETSEYCFYFSNFMSPMAVSHNTSVGATIAGIRTGPQHLSYFDNKDDSSLATHTNLIHPGIIHFGWDGVDTDYWSFGTATTSAPFEFAVPAAALPPSSAPAQFKISNRLVPSEFLDMGWDDVSNAGFVRADGAILRFNTSGFIANKPFVINTTAIYTDPVTGRGYAITNKASASGNELVAMLSNDFAVGTTGSAFTIKFGATSGDTYTQLSARDAGNTSVNNLILGHVDGLALVGIGTLAPVGKLDVVDAGGFGMIGSNVETNNTGKEFAWGIRHYANAEEPFFVLRGATTTSTNMLLLGGGSSSGNAATQIEFYTGATSTTVTGTRRMYIAANGEVFITLPTSAGTTGSLWNDSGTVKVAP